MRNRGVSAAPTLVIALRAMLYLLLNRMLNSAMKILSTACARLAHALADKRRGAQILSVLTLLVSLGMTYGLWLRVRPNAEQSLQLIIATGVAMSLLLALLVWLLVTVRARSLSLALAMTQELRESEELFRNHFERSMLGMATMGPDHAWSQVNDALCNMLGFSRDELLKMRWAELSVEEDLAPEQEKFEQLIRAEIDACALEKRFLHKDGHYVYARVALRGISKAGMVDHVVAQVEDVTEQKAAQARDRLLLAALDAVGNCVIITTPDSRVEYVNPAFETLTGYRREEALGKKSGGLMRSGIYDKAYYEQMWQTIISGEVWRGEIVNRRKDGSFYYDELVIAPVKDAEGKVCNYVAVNQDITVRKQIEEDIRTLNSVLEQRVIERTQALTSANQQLALEIEQHKQTEYLATSFSDRLREMTRRLIDVQEMERRRLAAELHDRIGSNLTAIGLNLGLMDAGLPASDSEEMADRVADCAALVEDSMVSARDISADLHPATLDYLGLLPALEEFGEKFQRRTGIEIRVAGAGAKKRLPPQIEIAVFRIAQEALTNCAKHAQASLVMMDLRVDAGRFVFTITDNGEGFDVSQLSGGGGKPGLGLLSMRERAEAIGGSLRIESEPGKGTSIVIESLLAEVAP